MIRKRFYCIETVTVDKVQHKVEGGVWVSSKKQAIQFIKKKAAKHFHVPINSVRCKKNQIYKFIPYYFEGEHSIQAAGVSYVAFAIRAFSKQGAVVTLNKKFKKELTRDSYKLLVRKDLLFKIENINECQYDKLEEEYFAIYLLDDEYDMSELQDPNYQNPEDYPAWLGGVETEDEFWEHT